MEFISGSILGVMVGLLLGPVLRSWLTWREYVEASRRTRRTDELLDEMSTASTRVAAGPDDEAA